jgi:hypothetical protein
LRPSKAAYAGAAIMMYPARMQAIIPSLRYLPPP